MADTRPLKIARVGVPEEDGSHDAGASNRTDSNENESRSEEDEPNIINSSNRSSVTHDHHDQHHENHQHHHESVDFQLNEVAKKFRVFVGDDVTLKSSFPEGANVAWTHDKVAIPEATTPILLLAGITAPQLGDYECCHAESGKVECCTLVKNKSPFKWCESCNHRNHAHAKQCTQCHHALHTKVRPPKRRCESLTMKNYEDAILEKLRALKEAHGDNVDTLCIISRRHYNRTLTNAYASPGAAHTFMQQPTLQTGIIFERLLTDSWTRWVEHYHLANGTRPTSERRRRDESISPLPHQPPPPSHMPTLDGSLNALMRSLQQQSPAAYPFTGPLLEAFPNSDGMAHAVQEVPMQGMNGMVSMAAMPPMSGPQCMPSLVLDQSMLPPSLPTLPMTSHYAYPGPYSMLLRPSMADSLPHSDRP